MRYHEVALEEPTEVGHQRDVPRGDVASADSQVLPFGFVGCGPIVHGSFELCPADRSGGRLKGWLK